MERMVKVTSMVDAQLGITDPSYGIKRRWQKRGQSLPIPFDVLEQLLYSDGVANMFKQGLLYIDNMKDKQDLGLEPLEATEPTNIIALNAKQIEELLTVKPIDVFKKEVSNLPDAQIDNVIDYAVEHKIVNAEKCAILKEVTNRDIIAMIKRRADMEAEEAAEKNRAAEGRRI